MKKIILYSFLGVFLFLKLHAQQIPVSPKLEFNKIREIGDELYHGPTDSRLLNTKAVNKTTATYLMTDSIVSWRLWDTLQAKWRPNPNFKFMDFMYNGNGNLIGYTFYEKIGTSWIYRNKYLLTYNSNGDIISQTSQTWDGTSWINSKMESITYDSRENKTIHLFQNWNGSNWINSIKNLYDYDVNNNEIMYLGQVWNGTIWVDFEKYLKTYDSKNGIISSINMSWSGTVWTNAYKEIYHYNAIQKIDTQTKQIWNGVWKNQEQTIFEYDVKLNRSSEVSKTWNGTWLDVNRILNSYDTSNNIILVLTQRLNGINWENSTSVSYTYDLNNVQKSRAKKYYTNQGTVFSGGDSTVFYTHYGNVGLSNVIAKDITLAIYPNPFSFATTITLPYNSDTWTMKIFNDVGVEIKSITFTGDQYVFEKGNLKPGIYFAGFMDEKGKMIKSKLVVN